MRVAPCALCTPPLVAGVAQEVTTDQPGTVWACARCGRCWIVRGDEWTITYWSPMTTLERWRSRQQLRERSTPSWA